MDYITKDKRKFKIGILNQEFEGKIGLIQVFSITNEYKKTYSYRLGITEELCGEDGWRLNTEEIIKEALREIGIRKIKVYLERKDFDFSVGRERSQKDILKTKDVHYSYKTYLKKLDEEIVSL